MYRTDTVVIGAGQAGLAMSRCLTDDGRDHVVLDRGRLAERWRSERWDSLRTLTPNWQTRLPGHAYRGPDPDGFMSATELVRFFEDYAASFSAPVQEETSVTGVEPVDGGYVVTTDQGTWTARNVVAATGYCDVPLVPAAADGLSGSIHQVAPSSYRNPEQLPSGGVLVVGASATGVQLADELHRDGRDVVLAVGRHTRLPRRYRGLDIMWWLDQMGVFDERWDEVPDIEAARRQPSVQLVGRPTGETLDLAVLRDSGVVLAGRLAGIDGTRVRFADDLGATTASADHRLAGLRSRIDRYAHATGLSSEVDPALPVGPVDVGEPSTSIDLAAAGISTVVWATGFRRTYPWLPGAVLDEHGELRHDGGVTALPGLYALGLRFMRRRKSSFIDGAGADARDIADHIAGRPGSAGSRHSLGASV